jgi:hypothetical protein
MKKRTRLVAGLLVAVVVGACLFLYIWAARWIDQTVNSMAPGAKITWSYAIPVPLLNTVYCGNVRISRPGQIPNSEEYVEAKRLTISKEDSPKEGDRAGLRHFRLSLEGIGGNIKGWSLAAARFGGHIFSDKENSGQGGADTDGDGFRRLEIVDGLIADLRLKSPGGRGMRALTVQSPRLAM